ncbi:MAG: hypothetical protein ACREQR_05295 [Candidatus Binataceae bacterium]
MGHVDFSIGCWLLPEHVNGLIEAMAGQELALDTGIVRTAPCDCVASKVDLDRDRLMIPWPRPHVIDPEACPARRKFRWRPFVTCAGLDIPRG